MSDYKTPTADLAYDRYADMLFRTAYAMLLSKHDAEDAVSDVFEKFIRKNKTFNDSEHEKAWFLRVTVNTCHDLQRRKSIRSYTPLEEIADISESSEKDTGILESVFALPEKYKMCILLHYFEGFSAKETASALGVSESAVKMRLMRAREMLKAELS